jgi:hypothetical protein
MHWRMFYHQYKIVYPVASFSSQTSDDSKLLTCVCVMFIYEWDLRFLLQWLARCLVSYVQEELANHQGCAFPQKHSYLTHPSTQSHVTQYNIHTRCCLYPKCVIGFGLGRLQAWILEYCDYYTFSMEIIVLCKWLPVADRQFVMLPALISRITVEKWSFHLTSPSGGWITTKCMSIHVSWASLKTRWLWPTLLPQLIACSGGREVVHQRTGLLR